MNIETFIKTLEDLPLLDKRYKSQDWRHDRLSAAVNFGLLRHKDFTSPEYASEHFLFYVSTSDAPSSYAIKLMDDSRNVFVHTYNYVSALKQKGISDAYIGEVRNILRFLNK